MQPIQMIFIHSDGSIQALDLSVPMNLSVFVPIEDTYSVVASSLVSDATIQFGEGTKEEMNALLLLITGLKGSIGQHPPYNQGLGNGPGFGGFAPPPNPFSMGPKTVVVRTRKDHLADTSGDAWLYVCSALAVNNDGAHRMHLEPRDLAQQLAFITL